MIGAKYKTTFSEFARRYIRHIDAFILIYGHSRKVIVDGSYPKVRFHFWNLLLLRCIAQQNLIKHLNMLWVLHTSANKSRALEQQFCWKIRKRSGASYLCKNLQMYFLRYLLLQKLSFCQNCTKNCCFQSFDKLSSIFNLVPSNSFFASYKPRTDELQVR